MTSLDTGIKIRHWMIALGSALALHAGVALYFGLQEASGAVAVGLGGVAVDLGTAGGSPGDAKAVEFDEATSEAASVPEAETVDPEAVTEAVAESVPTETVSEVTEAAEAPVAAPVETVAPEAPTEVAAAEVPLYAPEEPAEPEVAEVAEVVPPPVETADEPVEETTAAPAMATPALPPRKPQREPEKPQEVAARPQPAAEVKQHAESEVTSASRAPVVGETSPDALVGTGGKAGKGDTAAVGMERGEQAGGMPGQSPDYKLLLSAWLEKHKDYPRRAKLRRQEGMAYLSFVIDRDGNVLEYRLDQSTGYKLLDEEVEAMIERASPLPPVPGDPEDGRFTYQVPVTFNLR